jgi:serine/threonine-protein kinase
MALNPSFELRLEPELNLYYTSALAISPDGTQVAYTAGEASYLRRIDEVGFQRLPLPAGARNLFFSPDGRSLGFAGRDQRLQRLTLGDGQLHTICAAADVRGAAWAPSDSILLSPSFSSGLAMVSSRGGVGRQITQLDSTRGEVTHRWPEILPGGRAAVFTVRRREQLSYNEADIDLVDLTTKRRRTLISGGFQARYAPPGWLVFARDSTLWAGRFDLDRLEVVGPPKPLGVHVATNPPTGTAVYAIAGDGTLVFAPGSNASERFAQPMWLDRSGKVRKTFAVPARCENPVVSPDGGRLAVTLVDAQNDVGVVDIGSGRLTRLTFDPAEDVYPTWSHDGRSIAFASSRTGAMNVYVKPADGSGTASRLTFSSQNQVPCSWVPGDQILVYQEDHPESRGDLWALEIKRGVKRPLLRTLADERQAAISPDGRWLAYESNESGRFQIYVIGFPGTGGRWQVTQDGGHFPRWSPRGDELFYVTEDEALMAVEVDLTEGGFELRGEKRLFPAHMQDFTFDVTPDGESFVALTSEPGLDRLVVSVGWAGRIASKPADR